MAVTNIFRGQCFQHSYRLVLRLTSVIRYNPDTIDGMAVDGDWWQSRVTNLVYCKHKCWHLTDDYI